MLDQQKRLKEIIDLGLEVSRIKDIDLLLEKILTVARSFVNADAGSIYIKDEDKLLFSYTQNETLQNRLAPGKKLIYLTFTIPINKKSIAGCCATTGEILNIPDVYELKEGVPYSFDRNFDDISHYRTQSMLTFPLKNHRGDVIGVLQLINAKDNQGKIVPFNREDEPFIMHLANNAAMAIERAQMTRAIILRMIRMAELRDPKETGTHVNRVASYTVEIYENWASKRNVKSKEIEKNKDILRMAAMLHDVGKVAISDVILKKAARFTEEEYEIMKAHTYLGARLFKDTYSDFDEASKQVALNHHERWDGNGYPGYIDPNTGKVLPGHEDNNGEARGKKGEEIHPFGRLVAIADVFDALSSRRVYKEAWDEGRVLETMKNESGKQFDADMIDSFFSCIDVIYNISKRYPEE